MADRPRKTPVESMKKPWQWNGHLDDSMIKKEPGMSYRWVRTMAANGQDDLSNVSKWLSRGYTFVSADKLVGQGAMLTHQHPRFGSIILRGGDGMAYMQLPDELRDQYQQVNRERTDALMKAEKENLFRQNTSPRISQFTQEHTSRTEMGRLVDQE